MKLFEPGKIGTMELKNRILMAPMGIGALAEPDGRLSQRAIEYYTARARGGAAQRGHHVQLWERREELGGTLVPASVPEFKKDLRDLAAYLSGEVKKRQGVEVELGMDAGPAAVERAGADAVVVATGARPVMPDLPGREQSLVGTAWWEEIMAFLSAN